MSHPRPHPHSSKSPHHYHSHSQSQSQSHLSMGTPQLSSRESLVKADRLEQDLKQISISSSTNPHSASASASASNEAKASQIRIKLCEIFSDILLADCAFALKKDIASRLWYNCFYDRIQELRHKIRSVKERGKKREREWHHHQHSEIQESPTDTADANEKDKEELDQVRKKYAGRIAKAEDSLQNFIKEGILLYEFLIDRFKDNLTLTVSSQSQHSQSQYSRSHSQSKSQSQSQSQTHPSQTLSQSSSTSPDKPLTSSHITLIQRGSVPIAHKLYIHLGDLFRYASSFSKAEHAYLQASKLAPSKGNPYNQMAVVAQLKETPSAAGNKHPLPAISLYWYCRSLAADSVFETSRSNVERLFAVNRKWLLKNQNFLLNEQGLGQKHGHKHGHGHDDSNANSNANANTPTLKDALAHHSGNKEKVKFLKSMTSQIVLSRFVAFHELLFSKKGAQKKSDNDGNERDFISALKEEEQTLLAQFKDVLDLNPFGDGLMIKLVTIAIFTLWRSVGVGEDVTISSVSSYSFILSFAAQMAASLKIVLQKTVYKMDMSGKSAGSIRLLGPILLLYEYISHNVHSDFFRKMEPHVNTQLLDFWKHFGELADMITNTEAIAGIVDITSVRDDANTLPDDFQSLSKGCKSFQFIHRTNAGASAYPDGSALTESYENSNSSNLSTGGYVTPEEAVAALGISSESTATSVAETKSGTKAEIQTRIKLARFMVIISKHLDEGDLVKTEEGVIQAATEQMDMNDKILKAKEPEEINPTEPISQQGLQPVMPESLGIESTRSKEDQKDVLIYKQAQEGQPALLVPNALLLGNSGDLNENDDDTTADTRGKEDDGSSLLKLSAMILPSPTKPVDPTPAISTTLSQEEMPTSPKPRPPPGFQLPSSRQPPGFFDVSTTPTVRQAKSIDLPLYPADTRTGPPGFHTYPSQGHPAPQAFALPSQQPHSAPVTSHGANHIHHFNLPQTRNPFASSRLTRSYGLQDPNHLNYQLDGTIEPMDSDQNVGVNESSMDHDPFGFRSLGIFGDERPKPRDASTTNHLTRNPFY